MKKIIYLLISVTILSSCGVGSFTFSSGKEDLGGVSFIDTKSYPITFIVDGSQYSLNTVKNKAYQKDRNIKQTTANMLRLSPGQHKIEVFNNGKSIFSKIVLVSVNENILIEL